MLDHPSGENDDTLDIERMQNPDFVIKTNLQKRITRANRCAWGCGVSAFILLAVAVATPFGMNYVINSSAKKSSALTEANENSWKGIPGYYDIGLYWKHYMYNVTNFDDVRKSSFFINFRLFSRMRSPSSWSSVPTSTESTTITTT